MAVKMALGRLGGRSGEDATVPEAKATATSGAIGTKPGVSHRRPMSTITVSPEAASAPEALADDNSANAVNENAEITDFYANIKRQAAELDAAGPAATVAEIDVRRSADAGLSHDCGCGRTRTVIAEQLGIPPSVLFPLDPAEAARRRLAGRAKTPAAPTPADKRAAQPSHDVDDVDADFELPPWVGRPRQDRATIEFWLPLRRTAGPPHGWMLAMACDKPPASH